MSLRRSQFFAGLARLTSAGIPMQKAGEIIFAGVGRIPKQDADLVAPENLRVLSIPAAGENVGVRKLGVRRVTAAAPAVSGSSPQSSDAWEAYVGLRNDGAKPREIELLLSYAGVAAGSKTLTLEAGAESLV